MVRESRGRVFRHRSVVWRKREEREREAGLASEEASYAFQKGPSRDDRRRKSREMSDYQKLRMRLNGVVFPAKIQSVCVGRNGWEWVKKKKKVLVRMAPGDLQLVLSTCRRFSAVCNGVMRIAGGRAGSD